jgi:hypothetical protein
VICRTRGLGKWAGLCVVVTMTVNALEPVPANAGDAKKGTVLVRTCLLQLCAIVANIGELQNSSRSRRGHGGKRNGLSTRHGRIAVGAAVTLAGFVAETYAERAPAPTLRG